MASFHLLRVQPPHPELSPTGDLCLRWAERRHSWRRVSGGGRSYRLLLRHGGCHRFAFRTSTERDTRTAWIAMPALPYPKRPDRLPTAGRQSHKPQEVSTWTS